MNKRGLSPITLGLFNQVFTGRYKNNPIVLLFVIPVRKKTDQWELLPADKY